MRAEAVGEALPAGLVEAGPATVAVAGAEAPVPGAGVGLVATVHPMTLAPSSTATRADRHITCDRTLIGLVAAVGAQAGRATSRYSSRKPGLLSWRGRCDPYLVREPIVPSAFNLRRPLL
jgi:hypothetical protein